MPKLAWQSIVAFVVLLAGVWVVKCYGGSQYNRGRQEAEVAHSDSSHLWMQRGADSAQKLSDAVVTQLVRDRDQLRDSLRIVTQIASDAVARSRQANKVVNNIPHEVIDRADPRLKAAIDSLQRANADLDRAVVAVTAQNVRFTQQLTADSVAIVRLQESRDRWKASDSTASIEIRQLKALKTPKKPRFGFKSGVLTGFIGTLAAIIAVVVVAR